MSEESSRSVFLPGGWSLYGTDRKIIIKDVTWNMHRAFVGSILIIAIAAYLTLFALPLIGIISGKAQLKYCVIYTLFFCVGIAPTFLIWPLAIRLLIPWKIALVHESDCVLLSGGSIWRLLPARHCAPVHRIVARPAYHRGDWGYCLTIEFVNSRSSLLLPSRIITKSRSDAEHEAMIAANTIANYLEVESVSMGWKSQCGRNRSGGAG